MWQATKDVLSVCGGQHTSFLGRAGVMASGWGVQQTQQAGEEVQLCCRARTGQSGGSGGKENEGQIRLHLG